MKFKNIFEFEIKQAFDYVILLEKTTNVLIQDSYLLYVKGIYAVNFVLQIYPIN
jgi:hypothetical protein